MISSTVNSTGAESSGLPAHCSIYRCIYLSVYLTIYVFICLRRYVTLLLLVAVVAPSWTSALQLQDYLGLNGYRACFWSVLNQFAWAASSNPRIHPQLRRIRPQSRGNSSIPRKHANPLRKSSAKCFQDFISAHNSHSKNPTFSVPNPSSRNPKP